MATYSALEAKQTLASQSAGISVARIPSVEPPNAPWQKLLRAEARTGYLSIYYSDDLSPLAVRFVTKPGDHKSDPNLETGSYGLFSVCCPKMRAGVVKRGSEFLFFATSRAGTRVLAGYYHLQWYAQGVYNGKGKDDYCLAADRIRFISEPIPLSKIDRRCKTNVSGWFRNMRLLSGEQCLRIAEILDSQPDATPDYLEEIDRLERFNLRHTGYRYPTWRQEHKFAWEFAGDFLDQTGQVEGQPPKILNSSPSGQWRCLNCLGTVPSKALLKKCPLCKSIGTLQPFDAGQE